jgi:tetratricopeptide (TPR) repeat protein
MSSAALKRISPTAIQDELLRITTSPLFAHSERMRRFLTFIVNETLAGRERTLKEYPIALNVYDKPTSFDPRVDSIIRVEASRLRGKLQKYYGEAGSDDPLLIVLKKNSYVPDFTAATLKTSATDVECLNLKGRHLLKQCSADAIQRSMDCFTAASVLQPDSAVSMAGLADCYAAAAWLEVDSPENAWGQAIFFARRALAQTPDFIQAETTLACEKALHRWNWQIAEEEFQDVIRGDSNNSRARFCYAFFCLAPQGRLSEAIFHLNHAREQDPDSVAISSALGRVLYFKRRYTDALDELQHSIQLAPRIFLTYFYLGMVYVQLRRFTEAVASFSKAYELADDPLAIAGLGYIAALIGEWKIAAEATAHLNQLSGSRYVSPVSAALVEVASGDIMSAYQSLRLAVEYRSPRLVHVGVDPAFDAIKCEPQFLEILSCLSL